MFSKVPWHAIESVIEIKSSADRLSGARQCAAYLGALNQARPDKPGAYGVSIGPENYEILWSDPSGGYRSGPYQWNDEAGCSAIVDYVTSLYLPPENHHTADSSISPCDTKSQPAPLSEPFWKFDGLDGQLFNTLFVGRAHSRMTRVYGPRGQERLPVVKESYRPPHRRFKEEAMIAAIHKNGIVPGVVQARTHEPGTIMTITTDDVVLTRENPHPPTRMEKSRLIMDATGDDLSECRSVLDFLKVMFDAVEGQLVPE